MSNKNKFLLMSKVISKTVDFSVEKYKVLYENITNFNLKYLDEEAKNLLMELELDKNEYPEDTLDAFRDDIMDWKYFSEESIIILTHLMVVGLYSNYEKSLKRILIRSGLFTDNELKNAFTKKGLIRIFNKYSIIYEDENNPYFRIVDEIRILNNCIKHSGIVNQVLHDRNNKWIVGTEIGDLADEFFRLTFDRSSSNYLYQLAEKLSLNI